MDHDIFSSEDDLDDDELPNAEPVAINLVSASQGLTLQKTDADPFDEKGEWFSAGGYMVNENGIFREVLDPKTKIPRTVDVHQWAIAPTEVHDAVNEDGKKQFVSVMVKYQTATGEVDHTLVPLDDLELVGKSPFIGWPKPDSASNKSHVIRAILARIKHGKLPKRTAFTCCGWVRHGGKLQHVRPGHPLFVSRVDAEGVPQNSSVAGDFAVWKKVFGKMVLESPLFAYLAAIAFGGYARGLIPRSAQHSHIIYLFGLASTGKSTILSCLASIQGSTRKGETVFDAKSTAVGVERALPYFRHGPFFMDELDDVLRSDGGMEKLMFWANNGGRIKGAQQGGLSIGGNWDSPILGTGNTDLTEHPNFKKDMKAGAVRSRLEFHRIGDDFLHGFKDMDAVRHYLTTLSANHGHAYPRIIEALQKAAADAEAINADRDPVDEEPPEPNKYEARYDAFFRDLSGDESLRDVNAEMRLAEHLGFAMVGAELMKDVLGVDEWEAAMAAIAIVLDRYRRAVDSEGMGSSDENAWEEYDRAKQFIVLNAGRFVWEGYAYHDTESLQRSQAEALTQTATESTTSHGGAYGAVIQSKPMKDRQDLEGEVVLFTTGAEAMTKHGGLDSLQMVQSLRRLGLLFQSADEKGITKISGSHKKRWGAKTWQGIRFHLMNRKQFDAKRALEAQQDAEKTLDALDISTAAPIPTPAPAPVVPPAVKTAPVRVDADPVFPHPGTGRKPKQTHEELEHERLVDELLSQGLNVPSADEHGDFDYSSEYAEHDAFSSEDPPVASVRDRLNADEQEHEHDEH